LKNGKSFQVSSFYRLVGNTLLFTDFAFNAGIILLFHNPDIRLYAQVVQFKVPHLRPCIIFIFQSDISELGNDILDKRSLIIQKLDDKRRKNKHMIDGVQAGYSTFGPAWNAGASYLPYS
jgi:hypothetical protein